MLLLEFAALLVGCLGLIVLAALGLVELARRAWPREATTRAGRLRARTVAATAAVTALCFLCVGAIVRVPRGYAGLLVPGSDAPLSTLSPGAHWIWPGMDDLVLFDLREAVVSTEVPGPSGDATTLLEVQSKEGLPIGLAVDLRYRLDPERLEHVYTRVGSPVDSTLVEPVLVSTLRRLVPQYEVREAFSDKREELRERVAEALTERLGRDAVLVTEVLLRELALPPEYARGLEGLLLKQQESERMVYELEIKEKEVRRAELEAEAEKARQVKIAEAQARVHVLRAQAEADAMEHTLPLKEKQIEQRRLEAEAEKEALILQAEAQAVASEIAAKAQAERDRLMADVEAHHIQVTSVAEAQRMEREAAILKGNPLLIQKIVAERLSDNVQIVMAPLESQGFFASDVLRSSLAQR